MQPKFHQDHSLHLESVIRISRIPVVETSYNYATAFYGKLKRSNRLFTWGFSSAEAGVLLALEITLPAVSLFESPINTVDALLCRSLDLVEERVPAIHYPPKVMYSKTKDYVSNRVVQPVLKRADSVKQISLNSASKYSTMAATKLDNALDVADKYVDKYLPDVGDNPGDTTDSSAELINSGGSKTVQTIHHVNRFSRKLQRRLTRRTIAEARALKQQSADTLQCLIYLADLLARDPKAFMEKAKTMWAHLSEDEPENQVPPANLEQLIAMLTREVARRFVHLVNFTGSTASRLPKRVGHAVQVAAHNVNSLTDFILKTVHLDSLKVAAVAQAKLQFRKAQQIVNHFQIYGVKFLERILSSVNATARRVQPAPLLKQIAYNPHSESSAAVDHKKLSPSPQIQNNSQPSSNQNQSPAQNQSNQQTLAPPPHNQNNSSGSKKHKKHEAKQETPHIIEETVN